MHCMWHMYCCTYVPSNKLIVPSLSVPLEVLLTMLVVCCAGS
jgi:hypothetical protein